MMSKPVAGWLADKYTIKKTVFMFSIVLAAVFFFSLQVVPSIALDNSGSFHCTSPISLVQVFYSSKTSQFFQTNFSVND